MIVTKVDLRKKFVFKIGVLTEEDSSDKVKYAYYWAYGNNPDVEELIIAWENSRRPYFGPVDGHGWDLSKKDDLDQFREYDRRSRQRKSKEDEKDFTEWLVKEKIFEQRGYCYDCKDKFLIQALLQTRKSGALVAGNDYPPGPLDFGDYCLVVVDLRNHKPN